jgi:hypothetical protein
LRSSTKDYTRRLFWQVNWRFGIMGLVLYWLFKDKSGWHRQNGVKRLFGWTFFAFFILLFGVPLLFVSVAKLVLYIVLLAVCSVGYGQWAQRYFDHKVKTDQKEIFGSEKHF